MKSIFKLNYCIFFVLLFLTIDQTFARDIIIINIKKDSNLGPVVFKVLTQKFNFPREFIQLRPRNNECQKETINQESVIHLCINDQEEIIILKVNKFALENTLIEFINLKNEAQNEN